MASCQIEKAELSEDKETCKVTWLGGHTSRFHAEWLKFYCRCNECNPRLSGTYVPPDIAEFPDTILLSSTDVKKNEKGHELVVKILGHETTYPSDWLREHCYCDVCIKKNIERRDVINKFGREKEKGGKKEIPSLDFTEVFSTDDGFFKWLSLVVEYGFCLLKNVPDEEKISQKLAKKVGAIDITAYGKYFEVVDMGSKAENIGYQNVGLFFHQDQQMYESPPGILFLHAKRFDKCVEGGVSGITDIFLAAETLRKESPEDFKTLLEVPGTYRVIEHRNDLHYESEKFHIRLDYHGKIVGTSWHQTSAGVLQVREEDVSRYFKAQKALYRIIRRPETQYNYRLQTGDLMVINNKRMLHTRTAFQLNGGVRCLGGFYVKSEDFKKRYMILAEKLGIKVEPPKLGCNSSI